MDRNAKPSPSKASLLPVPEAMIALMTALGAAEEEWSALVERLVPVLTPGKAEKVEVDNAPPPASPERLSQDIVIVSIRVNHLVNKMREVRGQLEL